MTADETPFEERTPATEGAVRRVVSRPGQSRRGRLFGLRNWRVRWRLLAAVLIPMVAAVGLGGFRVVTSWEDARDYSHVEQLALLNRDVTALVHELQLERDLVAGYVARGRGGSPDQINKQQQRVDAALGAVREQAQKIDGSYSGVVQTKLAEALNRLDNLSAVRSAALETKLPASRAVAAYTDVISAQLDLTVEAAQAGDDSRLDSQTRALNALARAKEQVSQQRALLYVAVAEGDFQPSLHEAFLVADSAESSALNDFAEAAAVSHEQLYSDTVTGARVDHAARLESTALSRADSGGSDLGVSADEWFDASSTKINLMREVERQIVDDTVSRSGALQTQARIGALRDVGVVVLVVVLALSIALVVARSMSRPLRRLRSSALDVADERLPDVVRQLQQSDGRLANVSVERTPVDSTDEIGQVARAFDEVHEEAVRLATEQAALRGNVNAMFVNLSRRSQGLVERQLRLIDALENGEQDPDQLASLFKLDHLATRMRRHGENLLVLAGEEPGRRWGQPVPLVDVLRAAMSEVEQYERVELQGTPNAEVSGRAVNDIVHLIAELLENATSYSSREARVTVTSERLDDGRIMLQITDSGIGMPADELAAANERLATQPVVDVSASRRMGLFVVGRLAWRHGIRVQLRTPEAGGVTALIMLPATMVSERSDTGAMPAVSGAVPDALPRADEAQSPPAASGGAEEPGWPARVPGALSSGNGTAPAAPVAPGGVHPPAESGQPYPEVHGGNGAVSPPAPASGEPAFTGEFPPPQAFPEPAATGEFPPATAAEEPATSPQSFPAQERPDQPASPEPAAGTSSPDPVTGPATGPVTGPVTKVPSRPMYGNQPGTDPGAAPVQPHAVGRQQEPGRQPAPERAPEPSAQEPATGPLPSTPTESPYDEPGTPPPWYARPPVREESAMPGAGYAETERVASTRRLTDSGNIFEESGSSATEERSRPLPIFDAIQSEWFRQRTGRHALTPSSSDDPLSSPAWSQRPQRDVEQPSQWDAPAPAPASESAVQIDEQAWRSPGDEAWRAAEATVTAPASAGTTSAGLPKRQPGRNFVPGSAGGSQQSPAEGTPGAPRSADAVGSRLSNYHQGIRRGRHAGRELPEEDQVVDGRQDQENP